MAQIELKWLKQKQQEAASKLSAAQNLAVSGNSTEQEKPIGQVRETALAPSPDPPLSSP